MPTPVDERGESGTRAAIRRSLGMAASGKTFRPRRLAIAGVTILLFGLMAIPAIASPDAPTKGVSGASNAVGQVLGNDQESDDSQDTDGESTTAEHPDNHGADVSAVAHETSADGETHGEQVRAVARDNHGHQVNTDSTDTSESNDEQDSTEQDSTEDGTSGDEAPNEAEQNHGQQVRAVAQDNHGAAVSEAEQTSSDDGANHGEHVKSVARDNHGAEVSAAAQDGGKNQAEETDTDANDDDGNE